MALLASLRNGWFTEERVDGSTFVYSEYGHEEETHCYLLLGSGGALLIDTGMGIADLSTSVAQRATRRSARRPGRRHPRPLGPYREPRFFWPGLRP